MKELKQMERSWSVAAVSRSSDTAQENEFFLSLRLNRSNPLPSSVTSFLHDDSPNPYPPPGAPAHPPDHLLPLSPQPHR